MNNIILLFIEIIISLIGITVLFRKFNYEGLYAYAIIAFILSSLMSLKTITIYNFDINLGIISFVSVFLVSNIIIQKKGYEEVKKFILFIVIINIIACGYQYLTSIMDASKINLFTNKSFDNIYMDSIRIFFANIVTMLYVLIINSKLYYYLKKAKNKIWISNIFSGIIIQFLASCAFPFLAYALIKEPIEIIKIIIIRYMISLVAIIFGTIVLYIANKFKID